jgi:ABC-type phosphate transport system substrate-binding protein
MKKMLGALLLGAVTSFNVFADLVVVVHPENGADLSSKKVERIFLGKEKKFSNGKESIPINHDAGQPLRQAFDEQVLGRSTSQISAYWSKLIFTGKGTPPKEVMSDAEVIALIKENKGVIGYIDSASVTADVKVVSLN